MASADLRKLLDCSICLTIYTDPVTLRCGHNFCRLCIDQVLDTQDTAGVYSCPECREEFQEQPALQRNITLCNIVESFRSAQPDQEETGVFCTYCIHSPVPAVMSCLHCEASLCDNHLRVHSKSPEHVLCDPTTSLENRKCSVHKKILEYYCTVDSACICVSCRLDGDHQGHKVETLDEASEKKKQKLRNELQELITKTKETEKEVQSLQENKRKVHEKSSGVTERVTALFRDLRRQLDDLEKRVLREVSRQEEQLSLALADFIQQLEIKKAELSRKMCHIEELCNMTDPLPVLQESHTGDLCDTEEGDKEDREGHDGRDLDVALISHTLHTGLSDIIAGVTGGCIIQEEQLSLALADFIQQLEIKKAELSRKMGHIEELCNMTDPLPVLQESHTGDLCDTEEGDKEDREGHDGRDLDVALISHTLHTGLSDIIAGVIGGCIIQEATDILLDINTAHNNLHVSDDMKIVCRSYISQNRSETLERFQDDYQVLSRQSFSSGRHYWEVDVSKSEWWNVGMCYPSIARRGGQSGIGYNNKSWGLWRYNNRCGVLHNSRGIEFPDNVSSNRVGIYLDYEAGRLSFYDLCVPIRRLHTFTATFTTEPLQAILCVGQGSIKICGKRSNQHM